MSVDQWFSYIVRARYVEATDQRGIVVAAFVSSVDADRYMACLAAEGEQRVVYTVEQVAA